MKMKLKLQNLKCGGCERTIINKLSSIEGIEHVTINQKEASVSFQYKDERLIGITCELLSRLGYPVIGDRNNFGIKAKSYVSCAVGKLIK